MLNNSIKLFLFCLLIAQCSLKSNNEQSTRVFYTDRENPHAKMQLPVEISWSHDRAGNPNQPINVVVTARAFSNLTNAKMNLTFSPNLKVVSGDTSKTLATFASGTSTELNFTVSPEKTGSYDINILLNASLNGESIGTARTIRFETVDYVAEKPQAHPSGLDIKEGRTDYGK